MNLLNVFLIPAGHKLHMLGLLCLFVKELEDIFNILLRSSFALLNASISSGVH